MAVSSLRAAARDACTQFGTGLKRERATREDQRVRDAGREFGHALIETYVQLAGQEPSFSRRNPAVEGAGTPEGPLIRYLTHLYSLARQALGSDPDYATFVDDRIWDPSLETLAAWIKQYRKRPVPEI